MTRPDPIQDLLADFISETAPPPQVVDAAVARALPVPKPRWRRADSLGLGALLLAGLGASLVGSPAWLAPSPPVRPPPAHRALSSPSAPAEVPLMEGVTATFEGEGEARAQGGLLSVQWQVGRLSLRAPSPSWSVEATTAEGRLSLERGALTVERDALGSRFRLDEGEGTLRCEGAPERALSAGESALCLPVTAAGWRARALAQSAAGEAPEEVLRSLDAGVAWGDAPEPLAAELEAARVKPLMDAGREAEALQAAERYLAGPERPRSEALRRLAAAIALRAQDCSGALPHLKGLQAPSEEEARWLEVCAAEVSAAAE